MKYINPICSVTGCKKRPWYGYPRTFNAMCDVHRRGGMVSFPARRCSIHGCNGVGLFGNSMHRVCNTHIMSVRFSCFSCGNTQDMYHPCEPRFYSDARFCILCTNTPFHSNHGLQTVLELEGLVIKHSDLGFCIQSLSGVRVTINNDSCFTIHKLHLASYMAHSTRQAEIVILYNEHVYTDGEKVTKEHKRHDMLLDVVSTCLNMPHPDAFHMFRVVRMCYDGFVGQDIPFKTIIKLK